MDSQGHVIQNKETANALRKRPPEETIIYQNETWVIIDDFIDDKKPKGLRWYKLRSILGSRTDVTTMLEYTKINIDGVHGPFTSQGFFPNGDKYMINGEVYFRNDFYVDYFQGGDNLLYYDLVKLSDQTSHYQMLAADKAKFRIENYMDKSTACLLYTSPSPRDLSTSRMPSSA